MQRSRSRPSPEKPSRRIPIDAMLAGAVRDRSPLSYTRGDNSTLVQLSTRPISKKTTASCSSNVLTVQESEKESPGQPNSDKSSSSPSSPSSSWHKPSAPAVTHRLARIAVEDAAYTRRAVDASSPPSSVNKRHESLPPAAKSMRT